MISLTGASVLVCMSVLAIARSAEDNIPGSATNNSYEFRPTNGPSVFYKLVSP